MNINEGKGLACIELYSAISKSFSLSYSEENCLISRLILSCENRRGCFNSFSIR